jgi:DNA-directed RNA polymerase subunit E"
MDKACRLCNRLVKGNRCPECKSTNISDDWSGLVIILDPNSQIAKRINVKKDGRYALTVR